MMRCPSPSLDPCRKHPLPGCCSPESTVVVAHKAKQERNQSSNERERGREQLQHRDAKQGVSCWGFRGLLKKKSNVSRRRIKENSRRCLADLYVVTCLQVFEKLFLNQFL
eukprot:g54202.t1